MRFIYCFLFSFIVSGSLEAGSLKWEQSAIAVTAKPTDKIVEIEYVFSNTSNLPVRIRKISSSCSCTSAKIGKKVIQAGETGTLKVVFTVGRRKGRQEKAVIVASGKSTKDVLLLRVDIPDAGKGNKKSWW